MITDTFEIRVEREGSNWAFRIVEHNVNDVLVYDVFIDEPDSFAGVNLIEQPVKLKYHADYGCLKWESVQELEDFEYLEQLLSDRIINRHL